MQRKTWLVVLLGFVAACAADDAAVDSTGAEVSGPRPRYLVFKLAPAVAGSRRSAANSINDLGWIAGDSRDPTNTTTQATLWLYGTTIPLGTLGGPNSAVIWPVKNLFGVVSGIAETAELDPYGEAWSCSAFFPPRPADAGPRNVCRGFRWRNGRMEALGTFGGTHGFATGTNDFGVTVGWAENTVADSTCNPPQRFQFRAAAWLADGSIHELPPFADDRTSAATALNDRGQVVGISGDCGDAVGSVSARNMVLWTNGVPERLPDLGGTAWNTPMAINQRGVVVGFANAPDAADPLDFDVRAFRWTRERGTEPLGTLHDGETSQALGVNEAGQIVGTSCGATCRAFIYEDGRLRDLNDLVAPVEGEWLRFAGDINDFGIIAGQYQTTAGLRGAFVAIPTFFR